MGNYRDDKLLDTSSGYYAWCIHIMEEYTRGNIDRLEMRAMSSKSFYLRHQESKQRTSTTVGIHQRTGGGKC